MLRFITTSEHTAPAAAHAYKTRATLRGVKPRFRRR